MIEIKNSTFNVQGASKKDQVFGITLSGSEDVLIEDCTFSNKGYSSILNNSTGDVTVRNCTFNCDEVYNPIEGSQQVDNGNVTVTGCTFNGQAGNNAINFYQFKDKSIHMIDNCTFEPGINNNIVRVSNRGSRNANFTVKNCSYTYPEGSTATAYTGLLLCQDYTNKTGAKQDFSGCTVMLDNVTRDGVVLTSESDHVYYVYEDGKGVITDNDPVVIIR